MYSRSARVGSDVECAISGGSGELLPKKFTVTIRGSNKHTDKRVMDVEDALQKALRTAGFTLVSIDTSAG